MPANPGDGERYAQRVARLIDDHEIALLRELARLLRTNPDAPNWLADRLTQVQHLVWKAQRTGHTLNADLEKAVRDVILQAYNSGAAFALPDLDAAGIPVTRTSGVAVPVSEALAASTLAQTRRAIDRIPALLQAAYTDAVHAGAAEVLGGSSTRLQAAQHVLDRLLGQGIRGYRDAAGRQWALDTYVEMAVRTTTGQAAVQGHVDQLQAAGHDLVIVSDAPRGCPLCRPWEGKVLSIGGRVGAVIEPSVTTGAPTRITVAGSLEQARAAGLQHPNCRHSLSAYLPGATAPTKPEPDPAGYEASQRQRELERKVREWKRRQALALDDDQAAYAARKVRDWQRELRQHIDQNDLKRLRYREQVGTPSAPLAH